ncbi:hypothetical protein AmDm5_1965 [Acetobacter malorum]|nr:hypothetical protein AmDm5_1965 [Acetobacter malorum]
MHSAVAVLVSASPAGRQQGVRGRGVCQGPRHTATSRGTRRGAGAGSR